MQNIFRSIIGFCLIAGSCSLAGNKPDIDVEYFTAITSGRIIDGVTSTGSGGAQSHQLKGKWAEGWQLWITATARLDSRTSLHFQGGGLIGYDLLASPENGNIRRVKGSFFGLTQTYAQFDLRDIVPGLQTYVGYFPYKYSPETKNLGQYLFRSECYPSLLFTRNLNDPDPKILGVRISSSLFNDNWKQDVIISSESEVPPLFDYSFSYVTGIKIFTALELGAGGSLWRYLPVQAAVTTPGLNPDNITITTRNQAYYVDSITNDTILYTFKGIKAMARFSFDFKQWFPGLSDIMGKDDGKIYGEMAVLGFKNYPLYYEKLYQRIPRVIGFNVPMFKLLDNLSLEFEYYPYPNIPTTGWIYNRIFPNQDYIPDLFNHNEQIVPGKIRDYGVNDNWKWTIFIKRKLGENFLLMGQAARDHARLPDKDGVPDYQENYQLPGQWYWTMALAAVF